MIDKAILGYSLLRSGLYAIEGLPIVLIQKALKAGPSDLPDFSKETLQMINRKVMDFLAEDAKYFQRGVYPKALLVPENPIRHISRWRQILTDSVVVGLRRRRRHHSHLPEDKGVPSQEYPAYFLRNYHFQTGGYLSEESAELYSHQVEILFKGTAAAMRRLALRPLFRTHPPGENRYSILDVACGEGASLRVLATQYKSSRLVGVDMSPQYLSKARENLLDCENVDLLQGPAEKLVFKDTSFDVVTSTYLFHEIPLEVRGQVLAEMYRVLKPGGRLVISDSIQMDDDKDLNWAIQQFPVDFHEPFYKNYIQKPMQDLIEAAGFQVESIDRGFLTKTISAIRS